jgi:hypothetical protein
MIIHKCDICKREVPILETIILYKKPIDYCERCRNRIEKAKQEYKREIEYEYCLLDSRLKSKERNLIKNLKQENNKEITRKGDTNE